jgi:nitrite reductase/ring-hydroxylating ferredoxin subunit
VSRTGMPAGIVADRAVVTEMTLGRGVGGVTAISLPAGRSLPKAGRGRYNNRMTLQANTDEIRQIEAAGAPARFARGWHCLGLTREFGDGKPHAVLAFGKKLVVFRSGDGKINALDGYCRHMGGDLTEGEVKGDEIACPFHDWRWGGDGRCKRVPYSKRTPRLARTAKWTTLEDHLSISAANDVLLQMCLAYIEQTFGKDTDLAKKVTPDFAPYGKRIIRDPGGYYAALTRDHVDVEAGEPAEVNPKGIVTQHGRQIDLDVIIYATGYYLDFLSTIDIRGRDGKRLTDEWGDSPRAYCGGTVPGFPNLFTMSAPNYSPGHGAGANFSMEVLAHYIIECLQMMALQGATTMEVTRRAYEAYVAEIDEAMSRTVWCHTPNAHTYYRSGSGRVVVATPYRLVDVWHQHRAPIEKDFTLR